MTANPPAMHGDDDPIERTIRAITAVEQTAPSVGAVAAVEQTAPPPPGTGFALGRLLGKGGEGQVFEAVQRAFGRPVAVKLLSAAEPAPRQLRRFRAEAAVTALLEHPAIIPVHDLCLDEAGRPQLVMKRVSGKTWRALLEGAPGPQKRPLTGEEHVEILLKVCDAVAFAHSRGILHRDLKPDNVMVGEHGEVLVMDWGCAVHVGPHPPHPDIPVLSELGNVSGTPAYLSPEQARADHAECGPWTDVYLLGAILFRMLTGAPPHRGRTVSDTIATAARGEPPRDPAEGRKVPSELARIAQAAMHPDPAQRLRTAADFAQAIRRYLEHREVHRLLVDARRQHEQARQGGPDGDDAYRRAMSAVEQAVALWPEHVPARRMVVEVGLDSARHAVTAGAFRLARRQAQAAAAEAERLGDGAAVDAAQRVAALADSRERQARSREARIVAMRKLAVGGALVAGLALLVGLLAVARESAATNRALETAQRNLDEAQRERTARVEGERLAAPALLAQARELVIGKRLDEALPLVLAAQAFAPDDPAAWFMAGQILAAQGRRGDAAIALGRGLALKEDALARELLALCDKPPPDIEVRLAALLVRWGAGSMAGALNLAAEQKAATARQQILATWPKVSPYNIIAQPDGSLLLRVRRGDVQLDSLEPLRGLPISQLELMEQARLRDLAPLAALPLTRFAATGLPATDFTPLFGLPLRHLSLPEHQPDLAAIARLPLQTLELSAAGRADLAPLAPLALEELRLRNCNELKDLAVLAGKPLAVLHLTAGGQGGSTLSDLKPLAGLPLREVALTGQRGVTNLAPVLGPALRVLDLRDTGVDDLRPLLKLRLESVLLSQQNIRAGLPELARLPSLRQLNRLPPADYMVWSPIEKRLAAANPAYAWDAVPTVKDGKLTALEIERGVADLTPLRGHPLVSLAITNGPALDIAPLAEMPLDNLSLRYTRVSDLAPLARCTRLRRLVLYGTHTADLRPLAKLRLERLVFSPSTVREGIAELRAMTSLQQIGTTPSSLMPAAEFWATYDRGQLK